MSFELGLNITWPVGRSMSRLQYSCLSLLGGVGACTMVFASGSYSKNRIGCPQSLVRKSAPVKSTFPFGSRVAGQSLLTMVLPPTCGMSGPAVHVPDPVGVAGGE